MFQSKGREEAASAVATMPCMRVDLRVDWSLELGSEDGLPGAILPLLVLSGFRVSWLAVLVPVCIR